MEKSFVILLMLVLAGCFSDVVTSNYATYVEADADNLFKRGWLPAIVPSSTKNIKTKNNLDLNTSVGEFTIDIESSKEFIGQLELSKKVVNGCNIYKYTNGNSSWVFQINPNNGYVKYELTKIKPV